MKKLLMSLWVFALIFNLSAQTDAAREVGTTTKSGQYILPQAGDFGIGISATPILRYLGNSFNGATDNNNTDFFSFEDDVFDAPAIYGKYFLTDQTALRVKLHLGFSSVTDKDYVTDLNDDKGEREVENKTTSKDNGFGLSVGHEWRRGYGRLQGFFGPEVGLGFSSSSTTWEYGNDFLIENEKVSTSRRDLKKTSGTTFTGNIGGFAGVEYFIAPKISIGGEVSLRFTFASLSDAELEYEKIEGSSSLTVVKDTDKTAGGSGLDFSTRYNGNIFVAFYF